MADMFRQFEWDFGQCHPTCDTRGQELDGDVAEGYAQELKDAFDGAGTDEEKIISILIKCNRAQRQQVKKAYASFGSDLIEDLKSELSGDFEKAIIGLMMEEVEYDCMLLHDALTGPGTCEATIVGILCPKSNPEIDAVKEKYKEMYDKELIEDLQDDCSGDVGTVVYGIVEGGRVCDDGDDDDEEKANEQALKLQEAGRDTWWGTDEAAFNFILRNSSNTRLRKIMKKYYENTGAYLIDDIDSEFSGPMRDAFICILKCAVDESAYFADQLINAMEGWGTDEHQLIRVLVARCEIDLEDIKQKFQEQTGKSLEEQVDSECSGNLARILKCVIRNEYVSE